MSILLQITLVLVIALLMVPLSKRLRLPSVLGYLLTGIILSPGLLHLIQAPEVMRSFMQVSLMALMFWIGLQLRPQRILQIHPTLWMMATLQVLTSALIFSLMAWTFLQQSLLASIVIGLAGSLSAMTLVIQQLNNQQQFATSYGQQTYSILLVHALLAILVIAAIPLFAGIRSTEHGVAYFAAIIATLSGLFLCNRYLMQPLYRWIAKSGGHELHVIVTVTVILALLVLMNTLGINLFLGALFAGILLADSDFRPAVESTIRPFQGLLMGLAFISFGMSLHLPDLLDFPWMILGGTLALILIKFTVTLVLARYYQNSWRNTTLLAGSLAQGGEFALLALMIAVSDQIIRGDLLSPLLWMVSFSLLLAPAFYWLLHSQILPRLDRHNHLAATFETDINPQAHTPILLIGFGRFGQIIARILLQQQHAFSVMDSTVPATELLAQYDIPFYQADATEPAALMQAGVATVQQVIVAIDDIEDSMLILRHLRLNYPEISLWVRARDRHHVQLLQDLGVQHIWRETYLSALELSHALLDQLNTNPKDSQLQIQNFREQDEQLLSSQYDLDPEQHSTDKNYRNSLAELEYLFAQDQRYKAQTPETSQQPDTNSVTIDMLRDDLS
ncbi:cation:proton antiporter domain-containing protein [Acinetobacter pecorum]|uniref:Cation:proton antiporter n=1 Tax=Acinetobacter pecorum TaxID=2762215 RepID=A0ABR8VSP9_9GAMM|nr:cation:proton antiporter [Acinetobacter pecorum]MBD8007785.1 cation:proton antiporter [Acinetobacter pecorum]